MGEVSDRLRAALSGRYAIEREIGAGGMATVYLARDLRHNRQVALKVLRPELAAVVGADRFLAEIETTANLQHPHILPLFDSGEADGFVFYVMPYVDGETLRARLGRERQLPIGDAVRIATEVADALDYAHRQGIVHRDVKPANILLHDGRALVADFGIALAASRADGDRLTETGLSLGTPHYMSPEQASGERSVDARADVYALGCVLYEMLVGEPPFVGSSPRAVLASLLTDEPRAPSRSRKNVPAHLDAVTLRALEKLPADRFASAAEFRTALAAPAVQLRGRLPVVAWRRIAAVVPWALAATATVAGMVMASDAPSPTSEARHLMIALPDSAPFPLRPLMPLGVARRGLAVSPDGSDLVYVGYDGESTRLYRRRMASFESEPLPGTEGAADPFFSPDGGSVAFFAANQLRKVSLRGGEPVVLADSPNPRGGFWSATGEILFMSDWGLRFQSVPEGGGELRRVGASLRFWFPTALPREDFVLGTAGDPFAIIAVPLREGEPKVITEGTEPRYLPSGHLAFVRGSTLYAAPFDVQTLALTGEPQPITEGIRAEDGIAHYTVASDGTLYFVQGRDGDVSQLTWVTPAGAVDTLPLPGSFYGTTVVSPDGARLLTRTGGADDGLWIIDLVQGRRELVADADRLSAGVWSPDGSAVVYAEAADETGDTWRIVRQDLAGGKRDLATEPSFVEVSSWSSDGRWIAYQINSPDGAEDIRVVRADSAANPRTLVGTRDSEWGAAFSPDGRWIAYTSAGSRQFQVYVEPFPSTGERYLVSTHDDSEEPVWSPDGSRVYYRSGSRWWSVPMRFGQDVVPGRPELIVEGSYRNAPGRSWDLHPDGRRLLLLDGPREATADEIHVIQNWTGLASAASPSGRAR